MYDDGSFLAPDVPHTSGGPAQVSKGSSQLAVAESGTPTSSTGGLKSSTGGKKTMAGGPFSPPYRRMALHPIPRVVDNTDAMAIEQHAINISHTPIRRADMPGGPGTFSPYGNTNFK